MVSNARFVMRLKKSLGILGSALLYLTGAAQATTITYEYTDLADVVSDQDLWQVDYRVSDATFLADTGFFIDFDITSYTTLQDPAPFVNGDWDPLVIPPIPDDGSYDALALVDNASLADIFSLTFVWIGTGIPGAQPFSVYNETFTVIETGMTTAFNNGTVPMPAPLGLFAIGCVALGSRRWSSQT